MTRLDQLPADHMAHVTSLQHFYLQHDDPIRQSGFGGGALRWRAEREPILDAVEGDGDLLDIGCANGYLLESLVAWAAERGQTLTPFGLDIGEQLVDLARQRLPQFADNFFVGNGWDWQPPHRFRYVYALYDCVPLDYLPAYARRLLTSIVASGGRLIVGAYGSRSRQEAPLDVATVLQSGGFTLAGQSAGGSPIYARFAWTDR